jgi:hypothetical protein
MLQIQIPNEIRREVVAEMIVDLKGKHKWLATMEDQKSKIQTGQGRGAGRGPLKFLAQF